MERKVKKVFEFFVKGEDFRHLGDATLYIKKTLERFFENDNCFKNTEFHSNKDFLRRLGICMYETESNIVIHATNGGVKVMLCCDRIRVVTVDEGPGIRSLISAFTPGFSTASDLARAHGFGAGIGLNNIQKLADFFVIVSRANENTKSMFEIWRNCAEHDERRVAMKIKNIVNKLGLEILTKRINLEKEVADAYACDLLSNVLSKAREETAWLTVQTHLNIVGVASIKRVPIIIITEGNSVPEETVRKAEENKILIARAKEDTFELSGKLYNLFDEEGCK